MRIYLDTEFLEDGWTIELISIGLVREDGAELYLETEDAADLASGEDWLRENVLPHLRGGDHVVNKYKIRRAVLEFCGEAPEFWAYYADYDWVVLCRLFGRMIDLPQHWPRYCLDLKQELRRAPVGHRLLAQSGTKHDALEDARWLRDAHAALDAAAR